MHEHDCKYIDTVIIQKNSLVATQIKQASRECVIAMVCCLFVCKLEVAARICLRRRPGLDVEVGEPGSPPAAPGGDRRVASPGCPQSRSNTGGNRSNIAAHR
jgi:hypothetical protein